MGLNSRYEIRVKGVLDGRWTAWFEDLQVSSDGARRAGRRAPSMRLGLSLRGTLSYDDPRLDAGQRPATHEQPTAPPVPVMAARTRGSVS